MVTDQHVTLLLLLPTHCCHSLPQPIRILHTGGKCACSGAFSPDGQLLAVGLRCGGVKVYEFHPTTRQVGSGVQGVLAASVQFRHCRL